MEAEIAARTGERMVVVFLDVNAAYDSVLRDVLVEKLIEAECPGRIVRSVEKWMTDRRTRFIIGEDKEVELKVNKGLPQGGVLSPLLYAIYIKDILRNINPQTKIIQYADDVAVIVREENKIILKKRLAAAILQLGQNMEEIGLDLEHDKTNMVALRYGRCKTEEMVLKIKKDLVIRTTDSAKFLGVIFDRQLTWERQLNEVLGKANKILQIMKYLNKVTWGMEVNTAMIIYKSYVRSILDYGLFIYYPKHARNCIKVERCQFKG